jgi:hypothetical protein
MHGGKSTGARTEAGRQRILRAVTKHGFYSKRAIESRRQAREAFHQMKAMLAGGYPMT